MVSVVIVLQSYTLLRIFKLISSPHNEITHHEPYKNVTMTARSTVTTPSFTRKTSQKEQNQTLEKDIVTPKELTLFPQRNVSKPKITHIGFLKVHKAGSTTIQNFFFRFGLKHNLTFALPEEQHFFAKNVVAMPVVPGHHRDILACHSRYSRSFFESVLPKDTVNIGIIREPLDRMISAAYYYRDVWRRPLLINVPRLNFIHNLVNRPDLYELKPFSETKNAMGDDFGFSPTITVNDTVKIKHHLEMLKKDFELVLVMEKIDESLILMKRTLNWELSDVIYLKSNSHAHKPVLLNQTELSKFKNTCFLDYAVFDTFNEIFDARLSLEGSEFRQEVEHFKSVLDLVKDYCDKKSKVRLRKSLNIDKSAWNERFEITDGDCYYLQMKEIRFVDFLKRRHREMNIVNDLKRN